MSKIKKPSKHAKPTSTSMIPTPRPILTSMVKTSQPKVPMSFVRSATPNPSESNAQIKIILSLTTSPNRFDKWMQSIHHFENMPEIYQVLIHVCPIYKRFQRPLCPIDIHRIRMNPVLRSLNAKHGYEKFVIHVTDDVGPITKLMGGIEYLAHHNVIDAHLIVMDDDTIYSNDCLRYLAYHKTPNTIVSGSGFLFYSKLTYTSSNSTQRMIPVDIVEGFAGICVHSSDIDPALSQFTQYYKCIEWGSTHPSQQHLSNTFLKSCFLGDDMVISYFYQKKGKSLYKVNGVLEKIKQSDYGFGSDALHQNPVFHSNMGSYQFMYQHILMFDLFLLKPRMCSEIREQYQHKHISRDLFI